MLAEAAGIRKIILAVGYTDLRKCVDSLAQLVGTRYDLNPFERDVLFLFCGRRTDRIKGLIWEGNGFLLLQNRELLGDLFFMIYQHFRASRNAPERPGIHREMRFPGAHET